MQLKWFGHIQRKDKLLIVFMEIAKTGCPRGIGPKRMSKVEACTEAESKLSLG